MMNVTLNQQELTRLLNVARDGCYDRAGVCLRYGINNEDLANMLLAGTFPAPLKLDCGKEIWPERKLREFEDSLVS